MPSAFAIVSLSACIRTWVPTSLRNEYQPCHSGKDLFCSNGRALLWSAFDSPQTAHFSKAGTITRSLGRDHGLYQGSARAASTRARAIAHAIEQPAKVEIDEIVNRPTAQDF